MARSTQRVARWDKEREGRKGERDIRKDRIRNLEEERIRDQKPMTEGERKGRDVVGVRISRRNNEVR